MEKEKSLFGLFQRLSNFTVIRAIRDGLINIVPVLIIGAFALILQTFPVKVYQTFIATFLDGLLLELFRMVYSATFGALSVYMTLSISSSFMKIKANTDSVHLGAMIASLISFFMLSGAYLDNFSTENMGPKSMFLAIITALGSSSLYCAFEKLFKVRQRNVYSSGADRNFMRMMLSLGPITLVALSFAVFNMIVVNVFHVDSFRMLISSAFDKLFQIGPNGFFKGFFFVLLSSVLWFFGIHGSDTLEGVMQTYFAPGLAANQAAIAAGAAPTTILTKEFFDCFVLMGGCGSAICLLFAILIFSKNRARRGLGITAAFPMIFNISELMVIGLPIIYNPTMLIPFLLVPLVCYSVSYLVLSLGIVPLIISSVEWTTPIILGGYTATGSFAGAALQLFNVVVGTMIYFPFIKILDKQALEERKRNYESFINYFRENEQELSNVLITDQKDVYGDYAKDISADLKHDMYRNLYLAYQPQYNYEGKCVGVEALLRWKHPVHGMIYPPLIIKLAEEGGFLEDFEEKIVSKVFEERKDVLKHFGPDVKISFNVTGKTVISAQFLQFIRKLNETTPIAGMNMCLEVTEQVALAFNDDTIGSLKALKEIGFLLEIDDFSMGQTSVNYMKDNIFGVIKLDGSLVKGLNTHQNCREIISSIVTLANSLNMGVIAEFVETEEHRDLLHKIGCNCYQGYLYSPAIFIDKADMQK